MDNNDQKAKYDDKKDGEYNNYGDVVDAVPAADDGPPIPPGHQRFFCEKCRAVRWYIHTDLKLLLLLLLCAYCICVVFSRLQYFHLFSPS